MPGLIFRTLAELLAFAGCAFAIGSLLLAAIARIARAPGDAPPTARGAAVRVLAGFGGIAYATAVLALLHALRWWVLALLGVAALVAARRDLIAHARGLRRRARDRVTLIVLAVAGAMAAGQFLAALAPPEATDELAYHLPFARALDSPHAASELLHAHGLYANLPSLAECLYAAALAVDGVALVHALHLAILLAFIALAAAIVREQCGARAGAFAAVALLAYPDLTYNATTGYVDAAATAFELGALLLTFRWIARDEPTDLVAAALLLGFALSVKYSSLFTAAFVVVVAGVTIVRRREKRLGLTAGLVALFACAFWYAKNLVHFGNPFWPFYLGHRTLDDDTYNAFLNGVHAFGPRTPRAFVEVPWQFASDISFVPFLALSLVVLALFARPARPLALFAVGYITYWFWIATHQVRFLLTGIVASILAVTIAVAAGGRTLRVAFAVVAVVAIAVVQAERHTFSIATARSALAAKVGSPKAQYALGLESRSAYLRRYFGCEADAVSYLDAHPSLSPVLMRQTALEPWFARTTRFGKLPLSATTPERALRALRAGQFAAALVRESEPGTFATGVDASVPIERRLRPVWQQGDCTIYRVTAAG